MASYNQFWPWPLGLQPQYVETPLIRGPVEWVTITTTTTTPYQPTGEEAVRKIVRQELADLLPVDVPDAPPEDLNG